MRVTPPGQKEPFVTRHTLRRPERPLEAHVLLVEDNPINQEMARSMLQLLGCHSDLAENGREAVEAVARKRYDLVLMDCQMPLMDGYEATRAIRKAETTRVPIVALTANALPGDGERCLAAGMDDYLSKPFDVHGLRRIMVRWLPERAPDTAGRQPEAGPAPVAPAAEAAPSPINEKALDNIRALQAPGGPNLLAKVIGLYLSGSPKLLGDLREAAGRGDAAALRMAAHTLKSSSANLGAMALSASCKELETLAREGRIEGAAAAVAGIEAEFERVRARLETVQAAKG
jgi:CheY-like chemotaxis protein